MPFQRLKKQWSEISLEKKLAMFVAPVFVAVVSGILISGISGAFGSDDSSTTIDAGGLEVVDLEVTSGEVADEPGAPVDAPLIDLIGSQHRPGSLRHHRCQPASTQRGMDPEL